MRKSGRILSWMLALYMISALLAACSGGGSSEQPAAESPPAEQAAVPEASSEAPAEAPADSASELSGTISYFEPHYSDPSVIAGVDETVRMFKEIHPNVEFDIQYIPMAERTTKFLAAMAAGDGPDVACVGNMGDYRAFVEAGYLLDMGDSFISDPAAYWDRFPQSFVDYITIDDKKWGIPYYSGPYAMLYNKKAYADAGITEMPKTWPEFMETMKKLTVDADGDGIPDQYGFTMPTLRETAPRILSMFCWSNGGAISADDLKTVTVNSPECVEALEFLTSLVTEGVVPPGIGEADNDVIGEYFGSGMAATRMEGNWSLASIPAQFPEMADNIGVYPLPAPEGKTAIPLSILAVYSLTSQTDNIDASFAFIDFITSDAAQQAYLDISGYGPVTKTIIDANMEHPVYGGFIASTPNARIKPIYQNDAEVDDVLREAMQRAFLGQSTPKEALDIAAEKLGSII